MGAENKLFLVKMTMKFLLFGTVLVLCLMAAVEAVDQTTAAATTAGETGTTGSGTTGKVAPGGTGTRASVNSNMEASSQGNGNNSGPAAPNDDKSGDVPLMASITTWI